MVQALVPTPSPLDHAVVIPVRSDESLRPSPPLRKAKCHAAIGWWGTTTPSSHSFASRNRRLLHRRPPTIRSMRGASIAGSKRSAARSTICRRRRSAWPAGRRGGMRGGRGSRGEAANMIADGSGLPLSGLLCKPPLPRGARNPSWRSGGPCRVSSPLWGEVPNGARRRGETCKAPTIPPRRANAAGPPARMAPKAQSRRVRSPERASRPRRVGTRAPRHVLILQLRSTAQECIQAREEITSFAPGFPRAQKVAAERSRLARAKIEDIAGNVSARVLLTFC